MNCDNCKQASTVMLGMKPGKDGKPWALCSKCWENGPNMYMKKKEKR